MINTLIVIGVLVLLVLAAYWVIKHHNGSFWDDFILFEILESIFNVIGSVVIAAIASIGSDD